MMKAAARKHKRQMKKQTKMQIQIYQEFSVAVELDQIDWVYLYSILNPPDMVYYLVNSSQVKTTSTVLEELQKQVLLDEKASYHIRKVKQNEVDTLKLKEGEVIWGTNYPQIKSFQQKQWLAEFTKKMGYAGCVSKYDQHGKPQDTMFLVVPYVEQDIKEGIKILFDRKELKQVLAYLSHNMMKPGWQIIRNTSTFPQNQSIGPSETNLHNFKYYYRDHDNSYAKNF